MSGKIKTLFFAFCLLGFFLIVYFSWIQAKRENLLYCVSSVGNALVEYSNIGDFAASGETWHILNEKEADSLLELLGVAECPGGFAELPPDIRERKYRIAVRQKGRFQYEVRVWSNGFDNISGTADDLVFPDGEKALK